MSLGHQWLSFNPTKFLQEVLDKVINHGILGGDGVVKSVEEQGEQGNTTNNRLFIRREKW